MTRPFSKKSIGSGIRVSIPGILDIASRRANDPARARENMERPAHAYSSRPKEKL